MVKVAIKSEKLSPFGGIFSYERAIFPFCGSSYRQSVGSEVYVIRLSKREIVGSLSSVYFCGGDCVEEQWLRMGKAAKVFHGREHCVPAADSTHTKLLQIYHGKA